MLDQRPEGWALCSSTIAAAAANALVRLVASHAYCRRKVATGSSRAVGRVDFFADAISLWQRLFVRGETY